VPRSPIPPQSKPRLAGLTNARPSEAQEENDRRRHLTGVPNRPTGISCGSLREATLQVVAYSRRCVLMPPRGADPAPAKTAFTVMPCGARSNAKDRVNP